TLPTGPQLRHVKNFEIWLPTSLQSSTVYGPGRSIDKRGVIVASNLITLLPFAGRLGTEKPATAVSSPPRLARRARYAADCGTAVPVLFVSFASPTRWLPRSLRLALRKTSGSPVEAWAGAPAAAARTPRTPAT